MRAKKILTFVLFLIYIGCIALVAQNSPEKYIAYRTIDTIQIDGKLTEESWKNVDWTSDFIDIAKDIAPRYATKMKMLWDKQNIYFLVVMKEPHVWGDITKRDAVIFHNNDFEVFIDPNGDTHNYYEFEINALNTVWDLMLSRPYRYGARVDNGWDIKGLKTAVYVDGTLNNPTDIDNSWTVEIAMPWEAFKDYKRQSVNPKNNFWRFNFSRVQWKHDVDNGTYKRKINPKTGKRFAEDNWVWSKQGAVSMHMPEKWGYVFFSSKKAGQKTTWEIPNDEHLKSKLYLAFQKIWGNKRRSVKKHELTAIEIEGKSVTPVIEEEEKGWKVWVKSPFTNKIVAIKEDGKIIYDE